ncbi:MAG: 2Fe-2S iron-sulfur cluster-binding protein [Bacteroidota bacterium]
MTKITFITKTGDKHVLEADSGTIMELGVNNNIQGIDGECGGVCSCATCHVHVSKEYYSVVGEPEEIEKDMLELDDHVTAYSRLGCQINISEDLDGIVLEVANE